MKRMISSLILSLFVLIGTYAQEESRLWTLNDCIDYALEHNIQIKKKRLNLLSGEEDLLQSKAQLFPSLSGNISQNFGNYPSNDRSPNNSYNGNYGIDANWTLFDGGRRTTTIKQNEKQQDVNELNIQQNENDIRIALVKAYMQVLYATESVRINENTVEVSKEQRDRGEEFFKAGSISKVDLTQLEAQYSSDKYRLVSAQTNLDNYKMQLKQLLELDVMQDILIHEPTLNYKDVMQPLSNKETIYNTSLSVMPEIKTSQLNKEIAELEVKSARAGYYPSLSLSAGIGTGNSLVKTSEYGERRNFGDQLSYNFNESLGVSLSIPIYSNRSNKTAVNKAKLAVITNELEYVDTQKQLLSTVEGIYLDAVSSQNQYLAAAEQLLAVGESYSLIEQQFFLGMKNTLELLTAKNDLLTARQEVLQAKYMSILSIQLLNIYQGKPLTEM
ncbi:TolC family protein [Bacteroidales bacterium OttesenSCG-928-M11]|nr:TolC family protein [Bacteroidales bacterium OttesenSCG-928-M11]